MKKFASVLIAAILAAFVLPAAVLAGGSSSIISVPEMINVTPGAEFSVPIAATTPIYGASLSVHTVSGFETAAPPRFLGVLSSSSGVCAAADPSRGDVVRVVAGFGVSSPDQFGTLTWVAGDVGDFSFRVFGVATDDDLNEFEVDVWFVVRVRLLGDMDNSGVVDTNDAMDLAAGIVGWGGQPRWTAESHPHADMDNNGKLDHMDLVHLLRQIIGLYPLYGPVGKLTAGPNTPEVVANARKALADLSTKEGLIADQLREMILQLVPEAAESAVSGAVGVPTAVRSSSWGAIKASMTE